MRLSPFATFFSLAATLAPPQISASLADVVRRKRTNKADQLFKVDADGLGLDEVDTLDDNDLNELWSEANDATFFKDERMLENSYRMLGRDSSSMSYPNRIDKPPYDSSDEYIPPPPPPPPPPSVDGPTPRPPSPDGPTPSPPSPDGPTPLPPTPEGPTSPPEPSGPTIPPEPTEPTNPPEPSTSPAPTSAGDNCLEGTTREDYLLNLLSPITSPELLEDPDTPQGQAFEFLVDDDFDPCTYPTIYQRYGLSVLFFSTEGDDWDEDEGWLEIGVNECDWFNVTCGETDPDFVVAVHLEDNNLVGPLPPEISTLWTTEVLIFFDNALSSSIPEGIGNLTKLGLLDLESNDLTGTLFTESILGLTELQALRVSFNQLNGSIPEDITSLSKLTQLWLAVNQFSGGIPPELGELQSLETLLLYNNTFAGEIPEELGSLSNLTQLRLSGNVLDGGIPEEIYNANKLRVLRVDFNFMSGEISTNIGNLVELEDFRVNQQFPPGFTGSIPSELSQCTLLRNLLLNDNGFSGAFPNIFEDFEILEFVDVSNNDFSDEIPFSIFEVDTLRIAYFSNNSFTGPVPETFSSPPDLEDLYFDGNELSGNIPSIPADSLTALTELLFERNDLTGDMPQSICNLRNNDTGTAVLVALGSDCAGDPPEVNCSFPDCCNRCFS